MTNAFWETAASVLAAFIGSGCFAVIYNTRGGNVLCSALGGAIGWLVYLLTGPILNSDIAQTFAVSIFPLVPGASIYYTMLHAINGENDLFLTSLIHTIGIAGAIAVGSLLVSTIVRMTPWYHAPQPRREVSKV